jgi:hypothetical protein
MRGHGELTVLTWRFLDAEHGLYIGIGFRSPVGWSRPASTWKRCRLRRSDHTGRQVPFLGLFGWSASADEKVMLKMALTRVVSVLRHDILIDDS